MIKSKKTNTATRDSKKSEWQEVLKEYKKCFPQNPRSLQQLQNAYKNQLMKTKKELASDVINPRTTGGGPYIPNVTDTNPFLAHAQDSVTPLHNIDSSSTLYPMQNYGEIGSLAQIEQVLARRNASQINVVPVTQTSHSRHASVSAAGSQSSEVDQSNSASRRPRSRESSIITVISQSIEVRQSNSASQRSRSRQSNILDGLSQSSEVDQSNSASQRAPSRQSSNISAGRRTQTRQQLSDATRRRREIAVQSERARRINGMEAAKKSTFKTIRDTAKTYAKCRNLECKAKLKQIDAKTKYYTNKNELLLQQARSQQRRISQDQE